MPGLTPLIRTLARIALVSLAVAITPAKADAPPKFSQYPVKDVYSGPIAAPKINARKNPELLRAYREATRTAVNTGGRYILLKEFCGSACVLGHLQDARSGRIIRMPFTISNWHETEDNFEAIVTRANSRLIVFRGERNEEGVNGVHYYTLQSNGSLKHLHSDDTEGNFEKPLVVD